ncbi:amino acid adenylation domain protein (plasmid) [Gloeocapsa sp. PCC 7428]|uniref:non-ribosomal peptide synthetase n=1 Tax=Gloeocapsa sp. PCC 7428 TaxID=1173026 RepID=UPI0002A5CA02|nr:non-ribosomal peptide synthetase [Gloeocapsa sp. PCC 7428]AFZ33330.1 amino acid adenylation domain protein [Gloeocapsa sp. PCC 7428]
MTSTNTKQIEDIYPLSPMQQGMLFHSLYAPNSGVYIIQVSFEVSGVLDITAFEQAWQKVAERYAVLRTAFVWEKVEQPLQVVGRKIKIPIIFLDWRSIDIKTQQQQLDTLLQNQRQAGFNLAKAPLMNLTLIHKQLELYQCVWNYHHLLLDGWSVSLLLGEVLTCYTALSKNQALTLEKTTPYRDYIAWLQQQDIAQSRQFWCKTLAGFTTPTPFKVDKKSHLTQTNTNNQEQEKKLSPQTSSQLQAFAKQHKLTLNTLIQGAFALMLSRYSGENDIVFGATCSGRPASLPNSESIVGLLINSLPMRVQIKPLQKVIPWLHQLQQQQTELQQYEYTPLFEIQRWSNVDRGLPLFESLVIFENYPVKSVADINIQNIYTIEQNNYPLSLYIAVDSVLNLRILYDGERFESTTISRMLDHLQTLLEAILINPECCLSELPTLTSAERGLFRQWNNTKTEIFPQCIHQLIATQAQKTPDAIAAVFENEHITYEQLNTRANQLAHYLLQVTYITTETRVGVCLNRSIAMLIGLLGTLKAGSTYVPLDPSYPPERLQYMLEDAGVNVILTQDNIRLPLVPHAININLDRDWEMIAHYSEDNPPHQIIPKHLAYIIYTSGSTGNPKGVQVVHSALVNVLQSMQQHLQITSDDRWLAVTTIAFDIAAVELYLPLIVGASVVINSTHAIDGNSLQQYLTMQQATVMQATPATWNLLIDSGWRGSQNLKAISGGEALSSTLVKQLLARATQVWNVYGPTETTIWSSIFYLTEENTELTTTPIGKPLANTQFYVLDETLQPVPIGVPGELYIGGAGIARGYWHQPELTATKFIPNPFTTDGRERLYRTGDLVRYRSDGALEYLERIDYQVKLRGFRIELGEIATVLTQHPQVQQAVVVLHHDENCEDRLVAYVVLTADCGTNLASTLRHFLTTKLPAYMIPSVFISIDKLPLTANGKIDRKALPVPELTRPELETQYAIPRTEVEQAIAQIWQQVLKVDKIGIHDNFFELGGHSLLMVKVHNQLRAKFTFNISLVEMFRHPTISALTDYFSQANDPKLQLEDFRSEELAAGKLRLHQRLQRRKRPINGN